MIYTIGTTENPTMHDPAKVDAANRIYWETVLVPWLEHIKREMTPKPLCIPPYKLEDLS